MRKFSLVDPNSKDEGVGKYKPGELITHITDYVEIVISALMLIALIISTIVIIKDYPILWTGSGDSGFTTILGYFFNVVIGIEFIRMLAKHTPGSALEVVMYCLARHVIVDGGGALDKLLCVAAIGGIFAVRKFCFVHSFEEDPKENGKP